MAIGPDRLRARSVHLVALGAQVEVKVSGDRAPAAVEEIKRVWHMCLPEEAAATASRDGQPRAVVKVVHGERSVTKSDLARGKVQGSHLPDLMQHLTQAVTRAAIDAQRGRLVMFHAAGIQNPQSGNTVALVGRGGAGKTTLIRTLGPGWGYISDETVAIRDDNTILPYPKPLSVRRELGSYGKDETDPEHLGLLAPSAPARLSALVMLDRRDDHAGPPEVEPVPTLDAIATLTPETSHLPELEKPLQRMAALCESVGGVHQVTYRDAEQLGPLVEKWLESPE